MYQREFEQKLRGDLPKAVLLFGDNEYMLNHYIDIYKDRLEAREDMLSLYHDEYSFEQAKNYLAQSSLFGGINLLHLRVVKRYPKKI